MKCRAIILSVLAVCLMVSLPAIVIASTARDRGELVSGQADFADGISPAEGFRRWIDSGGRFHRNNIVAKGNFILAGEKIDLAGKWSTLWSILILDAQNNGRIMGTFNVTSDDDPDTVVWEGHFIFEVINGFSSGFFWATGSGPYEGKILEFNFDEDEGAATKDNPNPNIYLLNGVMTDPPEPPQ